MFDRVTMGASMRKYYWEKSKRILWHICFNVPVQRDKEMTQGSTYTVARACKTASWASEFWQSFPLNRTESILKRANLWIQACKKLITCQVLQLHSNCSRITILSFYTYPSIIYVSYNFSDWVGQICQTNAAHTVCKDKHEWSTIGDMSFMLT